MSPISCVEPASTQFAASRCGCAVSLSMSCDGAVLLVVGRVDDDVAGVVVVAGVQSPSSGLMSTRPSTPRTGIVVVIPKTLRPLSFVTALKLMSPVPTLIVTPGVDLDRLGVDGEASTPGRVTSPVNWTVSPPRPPLIVSELSPADRTLCDSASSNACRSGRSPGPGWTVPRARPRPRSLNRSLSPISVVVPARSAPLIVTLPAEIGDRLEARVDERHAVDDERARMRVVGLRDDASRAGRRRRGCRSRRRRRRRRPRASRRARARTCPCCPGAPVSVSTCAKVTPPACPRRRR